jgi:hypothetical protein
MNRIVCPHCHAPLSTAELEQVTINGLLSLVCPECSSVVISERQGEPNRQSLEGHFDEAPAIHA